MVPVVPLVHLDPPWSAISGVWLHEVDQARSRWTRSGPGALAGPWCWVVDQGCSGPPWSTKKHFPDIAGYRDCTARPVPPPRNAPDAPVTEAPAADAHHRPTQPAAPLMNSQSLFPFKDDRGMNVQVLRQEMR